MNKLLCFISAIFLLSGCTHYYYTPNTLNIPTIQKQHDTNIGIGRYKGAEAVGYETKAIYSPLKYTGVMFNHLNISRRTIEGSGNEWGKGRLTEAGVGGYWPHHHMTLSLFGGFGRGRVENAYDHLDQGILLPGSLSSRLVFNRWFVQPSLGVQFKWIHFGISTRRVFLHYIKGDIDYQIDPEELASIRKIDAKERFNFWETGISLGLYFKPVSLTFNNAIAKGKGFRFEDFQFSDYGSNVAIAIDIQELWRKKAKP